MNVVKMNVRRANYGKYSKNNKFKTKFVNGMEVPASANRFIEPYQYRSALYFDDKCGVKTRHIGCIINELRETYDLSRRAFAELATSKVAQYGIRVTEQNIFTYEHSYRYKGKGKVKNPCHPKADKMLGIVLARAALTGETVEEAFTAMSGYTDVLHRVNKAV